MIRANLAVMSILRGERLAPRDRIELLEVRAQWGRYAMRQRDLEIGVRRLESLGVIEIDAVRGRSYVVLTERGHRAIYSLAGFFESLMTWPRRFEQAIRRLRRTPAGAYPRRRNTDRGEDGR